MTDSSNPIVIINCGNCTPVGTQSGITAASVQAGLTGLIRSDRFADQSWDPIRIGYADYLASYLSIVEQFQKLSEPALQESLIPLVDLPIKKTKIPVILALPSNRPGLPDDLEKNLIDYLSSRWKHSHLIPLFETVNGSHTAGIIALQEARKRLMDTDFCIIGGVDSYIDEDTIYWLETEQQRLNCTENKDGFIPGQAAGFCLLTTSDTARRLGLNPLATLVAEAESNEKHPFASEKLSTGRGLTKSIQTVLKGMPEERTIDQIYATLNGEDYNTQDLAYTALNMGSSLGEVSNCIAPHSCWGDIGVASVPVLIGLSVEAGRKGYAKGPLNLIIAISLDASRGCALLELNMP